jgi:D-galactarolactone cycloisomerase
MKIREVKTYRLDAVLAEPFAYSQAWYDHRGALLVEIISEDGLSGWGEAFGPPLLTAPIVDFYTPLLVGTDAFATELHWQALYNRLRDHGQIASGGRSRISILRGSRNPSHPRIYRATGR